jgi:hypothetical protein
MVTPPDTPNILVCTAPDTPVTQMSLLLITTEGLLAVAAVVALSTTVLPLLDATVLELLDTVLLTVDDVTVSTAHAGDASVRNKARNIFRMASR